LAAALSVTSVLYHLAKFGWSDVALIERSVLTAGSSWHAAGGFHALNADPNIASLQAYTIDLLQRDREGKRPVGRHAHDRRAGAWPAHPTAGNGCNQPTAPSSPSASRTCAW
jgi:glycine/D-amino acid oxidase-like deaminating enzyme